MGHLKLRGGGSASDLLFQTCGHAKETLTGPWASSLLHRLIQPLLPWAGEGAVGENKGTDWGGGETGGEWDRTQECKGLMWGVKPGVGRVVLERENLSADSVSSTSKAQHHCLSAGSLGNFQACVFSYFRGTSVFSYFPGAEIISQHPLLICESGCRWRPLTHV